MPKAWRAVAGGVEVRVRATPRGGRDAIDGLDLLADGSAALKIRVRAAPEDGAANEALRRVLAKALGRPSSAVSLRAGASARLKTFWIDGASAELCEKLARIAGADAP